MAKKQREQKKVDKLEGQLSDHDLAKRKELLIEKKDCLKQREQIDAKIKLINSQLEALDRYLVQK